MNGTRTVVRFATGGAKTATLRLWSGEAGSKLPVSLPCQSAKLSVYVCGPTVYAPTHVGHARAYVTLDVVRRVLKRWGSVSTLWAMGVTDVDDKIVAAAGQHGTAASEVARRFERDFFRDMTALHVDPPDVRLRVSENIGAIQGMISQLARKGFAYKSPHAADVYFDLAKWGERYGRLDPSRKHEPTPAADGSAKKSSTDFALWKSATEADERVEAVWDSPWGRGRPGWHVECSAMSSAVFGRELSLHAGGIDLRFPHHENELALSEAAHDIRPWCEQWMHVGHLHIQGRKMSKSLKNFVSVREFLDGGGSPDIFRMFCCLHHYRASVDWGPDQMTTAARVWSEIQGFVSRACTDHDNEASAGLIHEWTRAALRMHAAQWRLRADVAHALANDFDVPRAVEAVRRAIRTANTVQMSVEKSGVAKGAVVAARAQLAREVQRVLENLGFAPQTAVGDVKRDDIGVITDALVELRAAVRSAARDRDMSNQDIRGKVLSACDLARKAALDAGVVVEDLKDGTGRWTRSSEVTE